MKTIIIGGGKGCKSVLGLAAGAFLKELKPDVVAVVDTNSEAPGMAYARDMGLLTFTDIRQALEIPDIQLIIELTGDDIFLQQLYSSLKPGIKLIDHTIARIFWDLVNMQEQLVHNEKLAALGKLAAGVAHEINNPLTGVLAYAEDLLEDTPKSNKHYDDINVIIRETLRCRDIVRNLLDFARQDNPKFELIDPNCIIEQSVQLVSKFPQLKDIKIETIKEENKILIQSDPKQIRQVILNLIQNAADAMRNKGHITIESCIIKKKGMYCISVKDTGPGIPEDLIDKIFEPFFSTKGTSGLGLAVSRGIIERHSGTIEVENLKDNGAVFRILLPAFPLIK